MPIIYAANTDGRVAEWATGGPTADAAWDSARSGLGKAAAPTATNSNAALFANSGATGGGYAYINRSFFAFDTSTVTSSIGYARLNLHGYPVNPSWPESTAIIVKATAPDLITNINQWDFRDIYNFWPGASGNSMDGIVAEYSKVFAGTSWDDGAYNSIKLNATALTDMSASNILKIAAVEYDHDYLNIRPTSGQYTVGLWYTDGTGKEPYIEYGFGYGNKACDVTPGDISIINGVNAGDILKIIGKL